MAVHPFNEFNLDPALAEAVAGVEPNFLIEGILRLDDPSEIPLEFGVVCRFDRIFTGRFRAADAWTIRQNSNVASLKAARPIGTPELERLLDAGSELPQRAVPPYTGRGSVVAALDFGLDFAHPNFRNADGSTRVLAFWNQGATYDISHPNSYGYGRVFSREEINKALEAEDPYGALGYHPSISDMGHGSHGTHTLDIAAGNGRVGAASAAAEAEILFVHLSTPRLDAAGNLGDSVRLLEGLDFVSRTAGDRPWVINLSVGRTAGSKDGTSLVEQAMHECLRMGSGRAISQSAGNYRSANLTVEGRVQEGESRELLWIIQPNDPTPNEFDMWYSAKDRLTIEIQPPQSTESIRVALGKMEEILYDGNVIGRIYHRKNDPNNGDNHCEVFLGTGAPAGTWIVRLVGEYVISGRFHAWIERDIGRAGAQSRFAPEIASERYTLGTIATSPLVITVGAYDSRDPSGPSAPFSSQGPTRDERMDKPELLAYGVSVVAARSTPRGETHQKGLTVALSGTSMAAPHVTGLVAAMYEAAGRSLSIHEIRDCLRLSAVPLDAPERGAYWGRVNAVEAIRLARGEPVAEAVADSTPEDDCPCRSGPSVLPNEASVDASADEREPIMDDIAADLVVQAELALSRSGGARRESETTFLRELLGALGWKPSGGAPSPARLFRLAAANDAAVGGVLKMIGGPSRRTSETLRPGDWLIRLAPGTGDVGHVSVLVSDDLMSRSRIRNEGIPAESSLPGYYGTVIEGGAYPHDRSTPFARRFLDSGGRVPPNSVILRPAPTGEATVAEDDPTACPWWLPQDRTTSYFSYAQQQTWGRATLLINGRFSKGDGTNKGRSEPFDRMQLAVEATNSGDAVYLAAWMFDPATELTKKPAKWKTWGDLIADRASNGVTFRLLLNDFPKLMKWASNLKGLDALILKLPHNKRDSVKYVLSQHPAYITLTDDVANAASQVWGVNVSAGPQHVAVHHQKFMVVRYQDHLTAFCGGVDIIPGMTPAMWSATPWRGWHDLQVNLEGPISRDIEKEFVWRWNRERGASQRPPLPGWRDHEKLELTPLSTAEKSPGVYRTAIQMLRTVSESTGDTLAKFITTRRDDVRQAYRHGIACASDFLYFENQYFRTPELADWIVARGAERPSLIVIIVVVHSALAEGDDGKNPYTDNGFFLQHQMFERLVTGLGAARVRFYEMNKRYVHAKLIFADDRWWCIGSANVNERSFQLDSELNVQIYEPDPEVLIGFRKQLWAHNLGVSEAEVGNWAVSAFITQWDKVAAANAGKGIDRMVGEGILSFDYKKFPGKKLPIDIGPLASLGMPGGGSRPDQVA